MTSKTCRDGFLCVHTHYAAADGSMWEIPSQDKYIDLLTERLRQAELTIVRLTKERDVALGYAICLQRPAIERPILMRLS